MKLNIGCGLEYKRGYVNVDAYDNTVADHVMSVINLEFDSQSFSHVDCIQLMEHLGAAKSIYALSEIYRVLKPGGSFLLETPDLVSSFKSFIKGDESSRKMIMNWIYGLDMPGMSHKYGFPEELLERMLHEAGFIDIEIVPLNPKSIHPSLRATCKKGDARIRQAITQFRKVLVEEKVVNLDNQVEVIEKDVLIRQLIHLTLKAGPAFEDRHLKAIVESSAVCSPKIGHVFLDSHNEKREYIEILETLDSVGFVDVLTYLFSEMPIKPGFQSETFDTVIKLGKQLVRKLIAGDQSAINEIKNTASKILGDESNDYFSMTGLELSSNRKIALGLKAFGLEQYADAINLLQDAIRLNRNSVIAFWNLARLSVLTKNPTKTEQYYSTVKNLLMLKHPTNYRNYMKILDQERKSVNEGIAKKYSRPIFVY